MDFFIAIILFFCYRSDVCINTDKINWITYEMKQFMLGAIMFLKMLVFKHSHEIN